MSSRFRSSSFTWQRGRAARAQVRGSTRVLVEEGRLRPWTEWCFISYPDVPVSSAVRPAAPTRCNPYRTYDTQTWFFAFNTRLKVTQISNKRLLYFFFTKLSDSFKWRCRLFLSDNFFIMKTLPCYWPKWIPLIGFFIDRLLPGLYAVNGV